MTDNKRKKKAAPRPAEKKDYNAILNDGWADDVKLHYPEPRRRPEDEMFVRDLDDTSPIPPVSDEDPEDYPTPVVQHIRIHKNTGQNDVPNDRPDEKRRSARNTAIKRPDRKSGKKRRKKNQVSAFRVFMILWLGGIAIAMGIGLSHFYDFLCKYEETYQASRPIHEMDRLFDTYFRTADIDSIYNMLSAKPEPGPLEDLDDVKQYMRALLDGKTLSYKPSENYTDELPEYYIEADGYIIAKALFRKDPTKSLDYQFPIWYLSELEYYTQPAESFRATVPEGFTVLVNGIPLDENYLTETTQVSAEREFFEPYADIADYKSYAGSGLYLPPEVSILREDGTPAENVQADTQTNTYSADFTPSPEDRKEMEDFAISAVTAYAQYISQDLSDAELERYFTPDNIFLYYAKNNSSRTFYTKHSSVTIENVEIRDFTAYSEDAYYAEVYLEQWMKLSYGGSEPEVVPTDARFYIVRYNGQWKVNGIKF